ncbi:hydrogenase isoenzymes nickel incorporation protein HypB [archaeon]|nr:hydrogenase isoenzymes nickel incorporation protein HypB [archaeon]
MHRVSDISVEADIIQANKAIAERNRKILEDNNVVGFDISGAIGSGKSSLIEEAVKALDLRTGVVAGDVLAKFDAERFKKLGVPTVPLNTGKECHLDAHIVSHALEELPLESLDVVFFENVGNLICPTDFDIGAHRRIIVVSVTEGDDIVEKHPMIFLKSQFAVINKIDIAEFVEASAEKMAEDAKRINPHIDVLLTSVRKKVNIDAWVEYLIRTVKEI